MQQNIFDAIVIGGGISGLWTTLDLALRGVKTALIEKSVIASETSGKFHGLLHSGARYAVTDPKAALDCIAENKILAEIAPHTVEDTGGFFVAISREDEEYYEKLARALGNIGIPYRELAPSEALKEEPQLNRESRIVIEVPDKVVYSRDLAVSIALTAFNNGAYILEGLEAIDVKRTGDDYLDVYVSDKTVGRTAVLRARAVVNATGPWAGIFARRIGIKVEVLPTAGTMVVYSKRLTKRVINRMRPPSEGDILVPYGDTSIMGTTAFLLEDPEATPTPSKEDIEFLTSEGSVMVPALAKTPVLRAYSSIRPLIKFKDREYATRDFEVVDHDNPRGLFTIVGGKFTTGRLIGEKAGDSVARYLGVGKPSQTRSIKLDGGDPYMELKRFRGSSSYRSLYSAVEHVLSLRGRIDEERGRSAAYAVLGGVISLESRKMLGL